MSESLPVSARGQRPVSTGWTVRRAASAQSRAPLPPLTQRYQITWLEADGSVGEAMRMGPALPLFFDTFAALGHGTVVQAEAGPMAVEDLLPGDRIQTASGLRTLLWKGSHTVLPGSRDRSLYRIPVEALGVGRPGQDLLLGPAARIVLRRGALRDVVGADAALVPLAPLTDGTSVIEITPVSAVQCFHLGFRQHTTFSANGVETESMHPGAIDPVYSEDALRLYLSMLPHMEALTGFGDLAMPRIGEDALARIAAA